MSFIIGMFVGVILTEYTARKWPDDTARQLFFIFVFAFSFAVTEVVLRMFFQH